MGKTKSFGLLALLWSILAGATPAGAADKVKIGLLKLSSGSPIFAAEDLGYFSREGIDAEIAFTDQPPILVAGLTSGAYDFIIGGLTAAFFNIAGQGTLRIIAGNVEEAPTFQALAVIVSNSAFNAGVRSIKDLAGHSDAITAAGSPPQYAAILLAQKYGFDGARIKWLQLGSLSNTISAVVGGTADFTVAPGTYIKAVLEKGEAKSLGWIGDLAPMQVQVVVTSGKTADTKPDLVTRFLRAYRAGAQDYHDAFADANDKRLDGLAAQKMYDIMAKYLAQPADTIAVAFIDRQGRVDVADVANQIAWYKANGMTKPEADAAKIIDARYAIPLASR